MKTDQAAHDAVAQLQTEAAEAQDYANELKAKFDQDAKQNKIAVNQEANVRSAQGYADRLKARAEEERTKLATNEVLAHFEESYREVIEQIVKSGAMDEIVEKPYLIAKIALTFAAEKFAPSKGQTGFKDMKNLRHFV